MITKIIDQVFGTKSVRFIKKREKILEKINSLETTMHKLSGDDMRKRVRDIKYKIQSGQPSSNYLPEVFAMVREASVRTIGHRHYDVQILGGIALYEGYIVEMGTGEGKTLVGTLPSFLRALEGQVHVITVNDYLAERDYKLMGKIYEYLGLSGGFCTQTHTYEEKNNLFTTKDIIYISNQQIMFHYLNFSLRKSNYLSGTNTICKFNQYYTIVDEVDNILCDEARTPFIISSPSNRKIIDLYLVLNDIVKDLIPEQHFQLDFKSRIVQLTDEGMNFMENILKEKNIVQGTWYSPDGCLAYHLVQQLLKAHHIFRKDIEYMVIHGEVVIIDENTGRMSLGRRYSNNLHQALEAKEAVEIQEESVTTLSITYPAFFRNYQIKCGMTGTASTEKEEFLDTYKLEIIQIPPNRKKIRVDNEIRLYKDRAIQLEETISLIKEKHNKGQPVLVVTTNVKESEDIEFILKDANIPHHVLNAKNHEQEAMYIANAGKKTAITIATNMAGRGTDIKLGGNIDFDIDKILLLSNESNENINNKEEETTLEEEIFLEDIRFQEMNLTNAQKRNIKNLLESYEPLKEEVKQLGGLTVIIFGMPESEKVLLQAIGRAGRQGDPGESYCFFSIEDDIFLTSLQDSWNKFLFSKIYEDGEKYVYGGPVISLVRRLWSIITAKNFRNRKDLNKYEEVKDEQRRDFFHYRDEVLASNNVRDIVIKSIDAFFIEDYKEYKKEKLEETIKILFVDEDDLKQQIYNSISLLPDDHLRHIILGSLDWAWKEHITTTESVEKGSGLVSYAQKDPFYEFRKQISHAFQGTVKKYRLNVIESILENTKQEKTHNPIDMLAELEKLQQQFGGQPNDLKEFFKKFNIEISNDNTDQSINNSEINDDKK